MELKIFQVDAFASDIFQGNPAAVVPLEQWLSDELMQKIAMENNLSETAFFVPIQDGFHIRWFTPMAEVDLCGHATLATAHVLYQHLNYNKKEILFESRSGILKVKRVDDLLYLNFPASELVEIEIPEYFKNAFRFQPIKCLKGRDDLMLIFKNEYEILNLNPDFHILSEAKVRGVIITSASESFGFVSRFFGPAVGINEDPVTGSAHTMLIPYWSTVLGKNKLVAKQVSKRGGVLHCINIGERVEIGGKAVTFLTGEIII